MFLGPGFFQSRQMLHDWVNFGIWVTALAGARAARRVFASICAGQWNQRTCNRIRVLRMVLGSWLCSMRMHFRTSNTRQSSTASVFAWVSTVVLRLRRRRITRSRVDPGATSSSSDCDWCNSSGVLSEAPPTVARVVSASVGVAGTARGIGVCVGGSGKFEF